MTPTITLRDGAKLFTYQIEGVLWLTTKRRALLGDTMGLGKTVQVIKAAEYLGLKKILIIAPPIARLTWQREFEKWCPSRKFKVQVLAKLTDREDPDAEVTVCSFQYAAKNFLTLSKTKRDLLVVDESHYLKTLSAKRTQAILAKGGVIHASARSWFLTGTPMPNHPAELWVTLYCFGATKLSHEDFITRYCKWYEFSGQRVVTGAKTEMLPELKNLLNSIMLRRRKEEVLKDLPPVTVSALPIEAKLSELTPELRAEFAELAKVIKSLEHVQDPTSQVGALATAAQSVSTLRRYCAMLKVDPVSELVTEELESNAYKKIVIFAIHREAVEKLTANLARFGAVSIHGGTSPEQRQRNIDLFQNDPKHRVVVANIQAASTNITLTAASQCIFLEQSWVPGDNQQAIGRLSRIGQLFNVFVRYCGLEGTVDEKVQEILNRKSEEIRLLHG